MRIRRGDYRGCEGLTIALYSVPAKCKDIVACIPSLTPPKAPRRNCRETIGCMASSGNCVGMDGISIVQTYS